MSYDEKRAARVGAKRCRQREYIRQIKRQLQEFEDYKDDRDLTSADEFRDILLNIEAKTQRTLAWRKP